MVMVSIYPRYLESVYTRSCCSHSNKSVLFLWILRVQIFFDIGTFCLLICFAFFIHLDATTYLAQWNLKSWICKEMVYTCMSNWISICILFVKVNNTRNASHTQTTTPVFDHERGIPEIIELLVVIMLLIYAVLRCLLLSEIKLLLLLKDWK